MSNEHGLVVGESTVARGVVREGAVFAEADGNEFAARATGGIGIADHCCDLVLSDTEAQRRESCFHDAIVDDGVALEGAVFGVVLDRAEGADSGLGKTPIRIGQRVEHQQGEIGAHGLVENNARPRRQLERSEEIVERGGRAIGVGPGKERHTGQWPLAVDIEGWDQQARTGAADHQQHRPLVAVRREAG